MKNGLKILITILLLMSFTVKAKAVPTVSGYTLVCGYEQTIHHSPSNGIGSAFDVQHKIYLYVNDGFSDGNKNYKIVYDDGAASTVTVSDAPSLNLYGDTGTCPSRGFEWYTITAKIKYCFENDTSSCNAIGKVMPGTGLGGSATQSISGSKKTIDVRNELENMVKTKVNAIPLGEECNQEELNGINSALSSISSALDTIVKKYGSSSFGDSLFGKRYSKEILKPVTDFQENELKTYKDKCAELAKKNPEIQLPDDFGAQVDKTFADVSAWLKEQMKYDITLDFSGGEGCDGLLGDTTDPNDPAYYIRLILLVMRYAAVALAVILGMIDFFKAIISQDKEAVMKAAKTSGYRLAFAVIIFFLPIVIDFIMGLLGDEFKLCISYILF